MSRSFTWGWIAALCLASSLLGSSRECCAETYRVGPDDEWFSLLTGDILKPGDVVELSAGIYSDPRRLAIRCSGEPNRPIVLRAAKGAEVIFKRPDDRQNTFNLEGVRHLHLSGFEITGGSSAIRMSPVDDEILSDIVLENLHIHHVGGAAITCNHPGGRYKRMRFSGNHIHHTSGHGEAFYLGGNNGSAILSDSIIENNHIHDLRGDSISQGDGIEIKQGSYGNVIRNNIIHGTNYPGIIVYGTAGEKPNLIENNIIWDTGDHGIQAAADAILRNNVVFATGACGIYSRLHQGAVPGNLRIENNLVFSGNGAAIRIVRPSDKTSGFSGPIELIDNRLFAGNGQPAIQGMTDPQLKLKGNFGVGQVVGLDVTPAQWRQSTEPPPQFLPGSKR